MSQTEKFTVAELMELGGKVWERGALKRVYFDNVAALVSLARRVPNEMYRRRISAQIDCGKFWYDCNTGKFHWTIRTTASFDVGLETARTVKSRILKHRKRSK